MSNSARWGIRFPRKRRADAKRVLPLDRPKRLRTRDATAVFGHESRPACAPALPQLAATSATEVSARCLASNDHDKVECLAHRLADGRTMPAWSFLANTRLFQFDFDDSVPVSRAAYAVKRGLQAMYQGTAVHIIDTFSKWRVPHADIAPVQASGDSWVLGRVQTVPCYKLYGICFEFVADVEARGVVRLRRKQAKDYPTVRPDLLSALTRTLQGPQDDRADVGPSVASANTVRTVIPAGAMQHMEETAARGRPHQTTPRGRCLDLRYVLDFPFPLPYDARTHRCRVCQSSESNEDGMSLAEWVAAEGRQQQVDVQGDQRAEGSSHTMVCIW